MSITSLPGLTGQQIVYFNPGDNNWGHAINKNMQVLAESIDAFKYEVEDAAKEVELAVARRFVQLREKMNEVVQEYTQALSTAREESIGELKSYIDAKLDTAIEQFIETTKDELTSIQTINTTLSSLLTTVQTKFETLTNKLETNTDRLETQIDNAANTTAAAKSDILNRLQVSQQTLDEHIADYNNPHKVTASQLTDRNVVYQPDPRGLDATAPISGESSSSSSESSSSEEESSSSSDSSSDSSGA